MPHDYHSRASSPEWLANYDRNFPPRRQGKRAATRKEEATEHSPEHIEDQRLEQEASLRAAFPFCPYLRE